MNYNWRPVNYCVFKIVQQLSSQGDYRLISYELKGCWFNMDKTKKKDYVFQILVKKVNQNHKVMEKNCEVLSP